MKGYIIYMDIWDYLDDEKPDERSLIDNEQRILVSLGHEDLSVFARVYVNKDDPLYELSKSIKPIDGFEDFMIHGQPNLVEHETNNGQWVQYTPQDFADFLIEEKDEYHGGNIRLLSCKSGMLDDGFAQKLANIMGVKVMAPTQTLWVNKDGDMFIADSEVLADLWGSGEDVKQTGAWKIFAPKKDGE